MKKIFGTMALLFMTALSACAETFIGIAVFPFSTENPTTTFTVKMNEPLVINNMISVKEGEYLYGNVTKVVDGQRGKRMGYFVFNPTYLADGKGKVKPLTDKTLKVKVSFYKPFDPKSAAKSLAENGAETAAGIILNIPMLSQGVSFIKGVTNPDEDSSNRITSGFKKVYKDSPLSYVEKGEPLILQKGQEVKLNFSNEY